MKRILIVGAGTGGSALLKILQETEQMEIVAIVDKNPDAKGLLIAKDLDVQVGTDWKEWLNEKIEIIIEATGNEEVLKELFEAEHDAVVIPGTVAYIISELFEEKEILLDELRTQAINQELILQNIRDGMIVINTEGIIDFINPSANKILGVDKEKVKGKYIGEIVNNTRLPHVLKSRRKEVNQKLLLENGKKVVATRIPIINEENQLKGALAVFKDITEVVNLAEENTDLVEIKTLLEAIIHSSDEAISVVDENGIGMMINPAYTRITGLQESDVVGKPATADISEGESMHMKVLQTRRPVRSARMKVGPGKKDVLVNVAPVIVEGQIKGSVGVIHDVSEIKALTTELKRARQIIRNLEAKYTFDDIVASSTEMTIALEQAKVGAKTPATVLLRGQSGTGKELVAHAIHNESERKHNKFIRVNCAAIAESILESELFGYEEGAFSGAKRGGKKGYFEEANMGSIFLDEIGELSLNMQAKLLRVLQENEIVRVGGTTPIPLDVRVIAATNVNLEKAIMTKTFREDLYYRLSRLPITIPPLKERLADLPILVQRIIQKINQDYGRNVKSISEDALSILNNYHWPGNVRELENVIGRAMIYMDMNEEVIEQIHLPAMTQTNKVLPMSLEDINTSHPLQKAMERYEKEYIKIAYRENDCNKTKTAKTLGISIRSLYYKMEKFELE